MALCKAGTPLVTWSVPFAGPVDTIAGALNVSMNDTKPAEGESDYVEACANVAMPVTSTLLMSLPLSKFCPSPKA